jgi:murein DD-endopeptidase MepM/ murein hydrolase activator NlpD
MHLGVDIRAKANTPVGATGSGIVIRSGWQDEKDHGKGFGQRVTIRHADGSTSTYGHLNSINVHKDEVVQRGQIIGLSGSTGKSTAPHLHYEEHDPHGQPRDPTFHPGGR